MCDSVQTMKSVIAILMGGPGYPQQTPNQHRSAHTMKPLWHIS